MLPTTGNTPRRRLPRRALGLGLGFVACFALNACAEPNAGGPPANATMADAGMPLLVHGEVVDPEVDVFDREQAFIALTSVFVLGPDRQESVPFLAVNREHILAGRRIPKRAEPTADEATELELAIPLEDPEAI